MFKKPKPVFAKVKIYPAYAYVIEEYILESKPDNRFQIINKYTYERISIAKNPSGKTIVTIAEKRMEPLEVKIEADEVEINI